MKSEILHVTPRYVVDEMALKAGHKVLRLPVAHCTLNPIELAWAQVKGHIKANTHEFNLTELEVECLAHEGFEMVTPERWASLVKHVRDRSRTTTGRLMDSLNTTVFGSSPSVSGGALRMTQMRSPVVRKTLPQTLRLTLTMILWPMMRVISNFLYVL